MSEKMKIVVDAMGGDNAPQAPVAGAVAAVKNRPDIEVILVGDEKAVGQELDKFPDAPLDRLSIVHASQVIETSEPPVAAIRGKKDSSLVVGLNLLRKGEASAIVSAGSTGALLVGGTVLVGRIRGVERAPLGVIIPTAKGVSLLIDGGANMDAKASYLVQYARMGSLYMKDVMGYENPTVGIVNIGAEEDKGNALVKETFPLLKEVTDINFVGSVEARDIAAGAVDVIVCDAFVGNVVLKMLEGTSAALIGLMKQSLTSTLRTKIGALLVKPALKGMMKKFDATAYGGAPLLGIKGLVVKVHGNTTGGEIEHALYQCESFTKAQIPEKITAMFAKAAPSDAEETS